MSSVAVVAHLLDVIIMLPILIVLGPEITTACT